MIIENNKPHVLIVEDDLSNSELFVYAFKDRFSLCTAESAEKAMVCLDNHHIDLILMDLALIGDMDGLALTSLIRKNEKWKDLPIIAITAHVMKYDEIRAINAGCTEFVSKPVRIKNLINIMEKYINKANP